MQKIMFEHRRFGLEQAVIVGTKTMTRRRIHFPGIDDEDVSNPVMGIDKKGRVYFTFSVATDQGTETVDVYPKYQIGEKVAIAQAYKNDDVLTYNAYNEDGTIRKGGAKLHREMLHSPGYRNKLFVRADLMPHVIEITDIKAERLQDISDEDCLKEGIIPVTWRQYPEPFSDHYVDHDLWTLEKYREQFEDAWSDDDPEAWAATSPKAAFAVLIRKLQGKKAWERNEWQFVYTFKLIK